MIYREDFADELCLVFQFISHYHSMSLVLMCSVLISGYQFCLRAWGYFSFYNLISTNVVMFSSIPLGYFVNEWRKQFVLGHLGARLILTFLPLLYNITCSSHLTTPLIYSNLSLEYILQVVINSKYISCKEYIYEIFFQVLYILPCFLLYKSSQRVPKHCWCHRCDNFVTETLMISIGKTRWEDSCLCNMVNRYFVGVCCHIHNQNYWIYIPSTQVLT